MDETKEDRICRHLVENLMVFKNMILILTVLNKNLVVAVMSLDRRREI